MWKSVKRGFLASLVIAGEATTFRDSSGWKAETAGVGGSKCSCGAGLDVVRLYQAPFDSLLRKGENLALIILGRSLNHFARFDQPSAYC